MGSPPRLAAQGISAKSAVAVAALGANRRLLAAATLTVSDEPACVASLDTLAVTSVSLSSAPAALASANLPPPADAFVSRVVVKAEQVLDWEAASATLQTIATYTDGTTADVTAASYTTYTRTAALALAGPTRPANLTGLPLPFSLRSGGGQPSAVVNASFGAAEQCGELLTTTWSVCSALPVSQGQPDLMLTGHPGASKAPTCT